MLKQKFISKKWFILMLVVLLLIPLTVDAQSPTVTGQAAATFDKVLESMIKVLATVLQVMQKFLWPIFLAIGGLLNNDLLFGHAMEERLLQVWVQVRNITNIGFVLLLLGLALWNVTGFVGKEEYQLKKFLPKLVIALIAVNFSFAAAKVVLDVSNVMTHVVFALPTTISEDIGNTGIVGNKTNENKICGALFGSTSDFKKQLTLHQKNLASAKKINPTEDPANFYCQLDASSKKYEFSARGKEYFGKYTSRNASLILAVQMMNIVETDKLTEAVKDGQKLKLSDLSFQILFSVVLYFVYAVAYITLFVVLIARLVYLWILIALSPLMVVKLILLPNLNLGDKDLFKEFINNAFVPVVIGIPLTIGYIMLGALKSVGKGTAISTDISLQIINVDNAAISDLQTFVIAIAAVATVWIGVFAAARMSIASAFIEQYIKGTLSSAGNKLIRAARFIPIIPGGKAGGGRSSIAELQKLIDAPFNKIQNKYGGNQQGPTKQSIRNLIKTTDVTGAEEAFRKGITRKDLQPELYKLAQKWERHGAGTKRGKFARKVFKAVGRERKQFSAGRLSGTGQQNILNAIGRTSPGVAPVRSGTRGTGTPRTPGAGSTVATGVTAGVLGVTSADDVGFAGSNHTQFQAAANKYNKGQHDDFNSLSRAHPAERKKYEAIHQTSRDLSDVKAVANAGSVSASKASGVSKSKIAELKVKLENAHSALDNKGIKNIGERKEILLQIVTKALGKGKEGFIEQPEYSEIRKLIK